MKISEILWTEKYRPTKIDDIVVPNFLKEKFKSGQLQNYLFYGSPGLGKTSVAKAIVKEFGYPYIYINSSKETSVDVVREKITDFCSTRSIMDEPGKLKVVILDECLQEDEKVRIGKLNNWKSIKLKNLEKNTIYDCISMNTETGKLENDTCEIISDKIDDLYEIELEDGKTINVTENHPFMILTKDSKIMEKSIKNGLSLTDNIICFL